MSAATATRESVLLEAALWYAREKGWRVFPCHSIRRGRCTCGALNCKSPGKHPRWMKGSLEHGCDSATTDEAIIRMWWKKWPDANIGMATGAGSGVWVLDEDPRHGGDHSRCSLEVKNCKLPDTLQSVTGSKGSHRFFLHPGGAIENPVAFAPGLDVRGDGGLVILPPSGHITGNRYEWDGLEGKKASIAKAPKWLLDIVTKFPRARKPPQRIPEIIPDGAKHKTCVSLAGTMRRRGCTAAEIYAALLKLSERFETSVADENLLHIANDVAQRYAPEIVGEPDHREEEAGSRQPAVAQHAPPTNVNLLAPPLTDSGNAERILALYSRDIRYCHQMKKFLVYNGQMWMVDNSRKVSHLAKKTTRLLFAQAADLPEQTEAQKEHKQAVERFARKSESAKGRKDALECLAAEQDGVPISEIELDPDPWKLNTTTGTIDLKTGDILPHRREDLISKMVPIDYDQHAQCPRFMQFLEEILGIGPESGQEQREHAKALIGYLQKAFGCAATGKPEKAVFVLYGEGNNGKTTLVETVRAALGDKEYAGEINIDSLMARAKEAASSNAINSDLADLRGCRFVSSSEVEQGQRLSLSRVKYLTGMGQIKSRRLGQDWITFKPTHKLFLDCNHKPVITDPNDAIWNRVKCIPFTATIERIDTNLPEKLRGELPGILRWIVEGAVRYHREGLSDSPEEVQIATESYRQESDRLKDFLEDRCILASGGDAEEWKRNKHWIPVDNLYPTYVAWAEAAGEKHPLSKPVFDERLQRLGKKRDRVRPDGGRKSKLVRVWLGIRLRTPDDDQEPEACDKDKPCDEV